MQKNTEPNTPAGKKRSSRNGIKHRAFRHELVSTWEDNKNFRQFLNRLTDDFQPTDTFEMLQLEQMTDRPRRKQDSHTSKRRR